MYNIFILLIVSEFDYGIQQSKAKIEENETLYAVVNAFLPN